MGLLSTHIFKKFCVFSTFRFYSRRFVETLHFPSFAALFSCGNSRTAVSILALSVTYGDTSPKGRGKSTAGNFLFTPDTLATSLRPWLSRWESWRGSAWEGFLPQKTIRNLAFQRSYVDKMKKSKNCKIFWKYVLTKGPSMDIIIKHRSSAKTNMWRYSSVG